MEYTHREEYYSAIKKNKNLPFAAIWTDLEDIMINEIKQRKDKHYMNITCMWNLKNKTR